MKKYKLLVALMLLIALMGKSVISLGVTQADVDAEKKKADKLKTEAEQKKKELTNIKSDKAVATTDLKKKNIKKKKRFLKRDWLLYIRKVVHLI